MEYFFFWKIVNILLIIIDKRFKRSKYLKFRVTIKGAVVMQKFTVIND